MPKLHQGFEVLPDVISASELETISNQLDGIGAVGTRCLLDNSWCQVLAAKVRDSVSASFLDLAQLVVVQATYFNKTSESNWFVSFHQDRSIPVADETPMTYRGWSRKEDRTFIQGPDATMAEMLAIRLHIDDSHLENGPLRVIPGSHRNGTLRQPEIDAIRDRESETTVTAERGSVIAMKPMLLHASSKSRTTESRRVVQFLCGPRTLPGELRWRATY